MSVVVLRCTEVTAAATETTAAIVVAMRTVEGNIDLNIFYT